MGTDVMSMSLKRLGTYWSAPQEFRHQSSVQMALISSPWQSLVTTRPHSVLGWLHLNLQVLSVWPCSSMAQISSLAHQWISTMQRPIGQRLQRSPLGVFWRASGMTGQVKGVVDGVEC
jgi:hypothetical protein